MRFHSLQPHPAVDPVILHDALSASIWRVPGAGLGVRFICRDGAVRLRFPAPQTPGIGVDLWRHTCCEVFIAEANSSAYREYNLSPSGQWASYSFAAYRQPVASFLAADPGIVFRRDATGWQLQAQLHEPVTEDFRLGISVVLEAMDGRVAYWALAHPAASLAADFHHAQSFVLHGAQIDETYPQSRIFE